MPRFYEITNQYTTGTGTESHSYEKPHASACYLEDIAYPFGELVSKFFSGGFFLDLASGDGVIAHQVGEKYPVKPVCLDISEIGLRMSQDDRIRSLTAPLPFRNGSISGLHFKDAMVHTPDHKLLISEISRVLITGGFGLIVSQYEYVSRFYAQISDGTNKASLDLPFIDEADCLAVYEANIRKYKNQNIEMGPPYFATNRYDTKQLLHDQNFLIIYNGFWMPDESQEEWHRTAARRYVLLFQKRV